MISVLFNPAINFLQKLRIPRILAAIFVYVGIEVGAPSIANLYMVNELSMDPGIAGSLVGTYWLLM